MEKFDNIELDMIYPSIESPTIDNILDHMRWIEDEIEDMDALSIYPDMSGHIGEDGDKDFIAFDNLQECVNKFLSFKATIIAWDKKSLSIDVTNFHGYSVCRIEEKMIDVDEWILDGNWLVTDGYMKNRKDAKGLLSFLITNNILPNGSSLVIDDWTKKNK